MFEATRQTLDTLEDREDDLTVSDVTGSFRDICNDVQRDREESFSDLPTGDAVKVADDIIFIMQNMRKLHNKNEDLFSEERYKERWRKATQGLDEAEKELERLRTEEDDLKEKEVKLQNLKTLIDEKKNKKDEIERDTQNSETELGKLNKAIEELQEKKELTDNNYQTEKTRLKNLEQEYKEKKEALDQVWAVWQKVLEAYQRDNAALKTDAVDADTINSQYEYLQKEIETFRSNYAKVLTVLR